MDVIKYYKEAAKSMSIAVPSTEYTVHGIKNPDYGKIVGAEVVMNATEFVIFNGGELGDDGYVHTSSYAAVSELLMRHFGSTRVENEIIKKSNLKFKKTVMLKIKDPMLKLKLKMNEIIGYTGSYITKPKEEHYVI